MQLNPYYLVIYLLHCKFKLLTTLIHFSISFIFWRHACHDEGNCWGYPALFPVISQVICLLNWTDCLVIYCCIALFKLFTATIHFYSWLMYEGLSPMERSIRPVDMRDVYFLKSGDSPSVWSLPSYNLLLYCRYRLLKNDDAFALNISYKRRMLR